MVCHSGSRRRHRSLDSRAGASLAVAGTAWRMQTTASSSRSDEMTALGTAVGKSWDGMRIDQADGSDRLWRW